MCVRGSKSRRSTSYYASFPTMRDDTLSYLHCKSVYASFHCLIHQHILRLTSIYPVTWAWVNSECNALLRTCGKLGRCIYAWLETGTSSFLRMCGELVQCVRGYAKSGASILQQKCVDLRQWFHQRRHQVPSRRSPFVLTNSGMAIQLFCQATIIITICGLWHTSNRNNGIATVGDSQNSYFDSAGFHPAPILSSSVVWATVPAWIMSAYSALWSAMLDALKKVHPTLELDRPNQKRFPGADAWQRFRVKLWHKLRLPRSRRRPLPSTPGVPNGCSTVKRTLLLDYGEWPVLNGLQALRAGHTLLGVCLVMRAALWTAGGLTAAVFSVARVPLETDVGLYSDKFFDEWLCWNYNKGANFSSSTPALDIVSATVVRDGANYPWSTDTHSFLPFFPASNSGPGNYTFDTEAYWATVECNVASEDDLVRVGGIGLVMEADDEFDSAQLRITYSFEGCDINKWFTITNTTQRYGRSWSVTDCSQAAGRMRLGIIAGAYNASEKFRLSNLSVVSCKPLMYRSNVTLSASISHDVATAQVLSFTENTKEQFWPLFATTWIHEIPLYSVFDPTTYLDMDTFSRLVIGHASGKPVLDTITGKQQIAESFTIIFQAFFANYVSLQAYYGAPRRDIIGTLSRQQLRLFVVKSAAFSVVSILASALIITLVLALHLSRNQASLEKHLDLMLGNALLFHRRAGNGLDTLIQVLEERAGRTPTCLANIDLVEYARQQKDLTNWLAWTEGTPAALHIRAPSTSLTESSVTSSAGSSAFEMNRRPTSDTQP